MPSFSDRIQRLDAHHRLLFSLVIAGLITIGLAGRLSLPVLIIVGWNAFSLSAVVLVWIHLLFVTDPNDYLTSAKLQDSSRTLIFLFVIASACASLFTIANLIIARKSLAHSSVVETALLTVGTVVSSWTLIHTVFAVHYAHLFYSNGRKAPGKQGKAVLQFPSEDQPDYLDFAYFSFVIGMTCQVSDVQICSRNVRRLALVHSLLAFLFNTVIVALSINLVSGLF